MTALSGRIYWGSDNGFKICCTVLAQGADNIGRQLITLVDPSADLADPALLALGLGLGLDIGVVVGIGHGGILIHDSGLSDRADEHAVGTHVHIVLHLQAHEGVDIVGQEAQAVVAAQLFHAFKFIHRTAALEAKALKHREGCRHIQAIYIEDAGLLDNMVGIVPLVDDHSHPVGVVRQLGNGVDDQAVVLLAFMWSPATTARRTTA